MSISIRPLTTADYSASSAINRSLPDWFGLDEGLEEADGYLRSHAGLVAEIDEKVVGYLTYDLLFPGSAEISWMAIAQSHHRQGIGRLLIEQLESILREKQVSLLSVKTLAETHPSVEYAATRAFYAGVGFQPQMVFPDLWDAANPCLLMVKTLH